MRRVAALLTAVRAAGNGGLLLGDWRLGCRLGLPTGIQVQLHLLGLDLDLLRRVRVRELVGHDGLLVSAYCAGMKLGKGNQALEGFDNPALDRVREQAAEATRARRKTFVARLPLPEGAETGDVPFWSAAIHQIGMHGWELSQWTVGSEPAGPVAYAVFSRD